MEAIKYYMKEKNHIGSKGVRLITLQFDLECSIVLNVLLNTFKLQTIML